MKLESLSKEDLFGKIMEKTSKDSEYVNELINEKKKKFAGLLTDEGAALMVAKELGVDLQMQAKISELEDGMKNANLLAKIIHVFAAKKFEKNGKKGTLLNIIIGDETGEIRLTLWNEQAELFEKQKIERNDSIGIKNGFVSTFNQKKQLSLGYSGTFALEKKEPQNKAQRLSEIKPGQNNVDVYGVLKRVFDEKTFNSNGKEGKLVAFEVADDNLTLRGVAWNEAGEEIKKAKQGEKIKIEGAYTKEGLNGTEINLGFSARVIVEPEKTI